MIRHGPNVKGSVRDGFDVTLQPGAPGCLGKDLPAGAKVRMGPRILPAVLPLSLTTLDRCL